MNDYEPNRQPQQPAYNTPVQQAGAPYQPPYQLPYQPPAAYVQPAPAFVLKRDEHPQRTLASKAINRVSIVTLMQVAASFLFTVPLTLIAMAVGVNLYTDSMGFQLLNAVSVPLCTALPFLVYLKMGKKDAARYLMFEHVGFGWGLLLVLAGLCICLLANYPAMAIQDFFGQFGYEPTDTLSLLGGDDSIPLFVVELLTTAVLVPVMEEFAFRGVLLSSLKRFGPGIAITISALIFSLVHLDFSNVVFAFVAGLVFGALYYYTENLWLSIAIHALNNGFAVIGSTAPKLFGADEFLLEVVLMYVPVFLGLVALIVLAALRRRIRLSGVGRQAEVSLTAGESFSALVRAPMFWLVFGMMAVYTATLFF